jgi:Na+/H+ antiporter NhaD/arsenite permease-like protein
MKNFHRAPASARESKTADERFYLRGLPNLGFLGLILLAVFLPKSVQEMVIGGVFSVPALVMIAAGIGSYFTSKPEVHEANDFNFGPVKEVGYLFIGIFLTMVPALQILQSGEAVKINSPLAYYFATGALSAFLDNAPTYLSFLAAAMGTADRSVDSAADVLAFSGSHAAHLIAISLGAVFFGAGSYIGNGPNFMVKSIADKAKVHTPDFLRYIWQFSIPILLPILIIVGWIFVS